ncbi:hypothetical protein P152DRAFT_297320 [Eremomyces bilateralis CBS 781.70]|uniref:Uncharacterized protein n=1 Tax=Eremomyces bilateralis CBS 781.70 TaxID=1392243 RepID=A0A6G1G7J1_9PEZI|nr:uncharacterized protein P152DRAFT_297320 [Eremomyces bilateralis CBS 781.70]KAF1813906.1 hypothetical protein P152DRAFT_297320 [Eremomyces bilateralis CBS 781.70]
MRRFKGQNTDKGILLRKSFSIAQRSSRSYLRSRKGAVKAKCDGGTAVIRKRIALAEHETRLYVNIYLRLFVFPSEPQGLGQPCRIRGWVADCGPVLAGIPQVAVPMRKREPLDPMEPSKPSRGLFGNPASSLALDCSICLHAEIDAMTSIGRSYGQTHSQ